MDLQRLTSLLRQCIQRYDMISPDDAIAVGLSGGKDSLCLLMGLAALRRFSPVPFTLHAIHVDVGAGMSAESIARMADFCARLDVPFHHVRTDIYQIVFEERKEKNPCSLCAKMRKGALNAKALELGCCKIAYAHHKDDFIETLVMNLMMEGRAECFPPVTQLDKTGLQVIRPMLYVEEADVRGFTRRYDLPVVANPCPADGKTRREDVKQFIKDSRATFPKIRESLFSAVTGLFDKEG
ncbi:MAG: tRNA 2-thiocytidine biosynthesis protein TtcA [Clostridia bacterium]|nr:tRNA 2-thiocytidine biosynthesis protein TtcA [Clostridia bacterium]